MKKRGDVGFGFFVSGLSEKGITEKRHVWDRNYGEYPSWCGKEVAIGMRYKKGREVIWIFVTAAGRATRGVLLEESGMWTTKLEICLLLFWVAELGGFDWWFECNFLK